MKSHPAGAFSRAASAHRVAAITMCACALGCAAPRAPIAAPTDFKAPAELKWFRTAAERVAAYAQAYRYATEIVARKSAAAPGAWSVVLDVDETVLDNSAYQDRLARAGERFSVDSWNAWVREQRAVAFPSAKAFILFVQKMGGRVAIVTNRDDSVCEDTRKNLLAEGIAPEALLCASGGVESKEPRFASVESGAAFADRRAAPVLLFIGDNIQDCPGETQGRPPNTDKFGDRCIVLPNPMYGSWTSNDYR